MLTSKIIHPEISKRNWIFCRDGQDDFNKAIEETRKTIHTDYEWLKYHTELQVKALKWEQKKDNSRLLRGKELREAEQQLASVGSKKDPQPTDLQRLFVSQSRKAEQNRQKTITRIAVGVSTIVCLLCMIAIVGGSIAYVQNKAAATAQIQVTEQKNIADTRQLATIANNLSLEQGNTAILSGLLAVEAARRYPELESDQAMRRFLSLAVLPISSTKFNNSVTSVDFNQNGKWAVAASLDGTVQIWDVETSEEIVRLKLLLSPFVSYVKFSPNGEWLVATDCDHSEVTTRDVTICTNVIARIFDTTNWQEVSRIMQSNGINSITFSSDSKWLASGGNDGTVKVSEIPTGKEISKITSGGGSVPVAFSPNGDLIASVGENMAIVWDSTTGREISRMIHDDGVSSVAFSLDNKWIVSAGSTIKIWESYTGKEIIHMILNKSSAFSVAFSPDGKWVISNGNDYIVRVWDATTGQEISHMAGGESHSCLFQP